MGAGDVKLMAAIGALTGVSFVFNAFLYTAIIGGFISIILVMKHKGFFTSVKSFFFLLPFLRSNLGSFIHTDRKQAKITFPYGVAIFLGTLCATFWGVV
jgi:prepilin peptidase CpaA